MRRFLTLLVLALCSAPLGARSLTLVQSGVQQQRFSVGGSQAGGAVGNSLLQAANNFLDFMNSPWVAVLSGAVFCALVFAWAMFQKDENLKEGIVRIIVGTMLISSAPSIAVIFGQIVMASGSLR